jgi:hypothetical protein
MGQKVQLRFVPARQVLGDREKGPAELANFSDQVSAALREQFAVLASNSLEE